MTGPSQSWRPEHLDTQASWEKTKDIRYAALEIGRWYTRPDWPRSSPPLWAMEACAQFFEKSLAHIGPLIQKRKGGKPTGLEYDVIDRVARVRNSQSGKTSSIFRKILRDEMGYKDDALESTLRTYMRHWGDETVSTEGFYCNDHITRVAKKDALARGLGRSFEDWAEDIPLPRWKTKSDIPDD